MLSIIDVEPFNLSSYPLPASGTDKLIASYAERNNRRWLYSLVLLICCFLASIFYGLFSIYTGYAQFNPFVPLDWLQTWIFIALLALAAICILLAYRLGRRQRFFAIHQDGLRWRFSGRQLHFLPWEKVSGVATAFTQHHFLSLPLHMHYRALLYPTHGDPIELDEYLQKIPELITRLKASLYPRLLPRLENRWAKGEWLSFGAVSIHPSGFRWIKKRISSPFIYPPLPGDSWRQAAWEHIQRLSIDSGFLVVESQNYGRQRIPISQIPNYELLFQMIQQGIAP